MSVADASHQQMVRGLAGDEQHSKGHVAAPATFVRGVSKFGKRSDDGIGPLLPPGGFIYDAGKKETKSDDGIGPLFPPGVFLYTTGGNEEKGNETTKTLSADPSETSGQSLF